MLRPATKAACDHTKRPEVKARQPSTVVTAAKTALPAFAARWHVGTLVAARESLCSRLKIGV
jgi:hypothetical protein